MAPTGERLAQLSRTAALRAAALTSWVDHARLGTEGLAAVLYRSGGCLPSGRVDAQWPALLLRRAERGVRTRLADYSRAATQGWMSWTRTDADVADLVHKVYVSPAVSSLVAALPPTLALALDLGVPAWKVGADLPGIHRSDKVVLYLASAAAADAAADALATSLAPLAAQGVPFTGQVGDSGIVSRGHDRNGTSWRAVVCHTLAEALWDARAEAGAHAPAEQVANVALGVLAGDGFDVIQWRPAPAPVGAEP